MRKREQSLFWADQLADRIEERSGREKRKPNIKCQQTPSGGKHIGNLNDVARAYFPYKSLIERGIKAEFVRDATLLKFRYIDRSTDQNFVGFCISYIAAQCVVKRARGLDLLFTFCGFDDNMIFDDHVYEVCLV